MCVRIFFFKFLLLIVCFIYFTIWHSICLDVYDALEDKMMYFLSVYDFDLEIIGLMILDMVVSV